MSALKGKTTQRRPPIVESPVSSMGTHILKEFQMVTLCIDVMYINQNQMLVSISRNSKFGMVEALTNNKTPILLNGLKQIMKIYMQFGFVVSTD